MQLKTFVQYLQQEIPNAYAEEYDNVGLLVGDLEMKISGVLVTLDTLEETVEEAITKKCNVIVSFHPIIFKGLKSLTGKNYVERTVLKAIKHDVAIYAIHTALDNQLSGVSGYMAKHLNLDNVKLLTTQQNTLKKIITYVPEQEANKVRQALFSVGAGSIGHYQDCSFNNQGVGTFLPKSTATPTIGEIGRLEEVSETQITVYFEKHLEAAVLQSLRQSHPYEEVAYELTTLDNKNQKIGMGVVGELKETLSELDFLSLLKESFKTTNIRHSKLLNKPVKTIALLGGSGSFAISKAIAAKADVYVSSDFKYHDFFTANNQILLADIGHYESEQYTKRMMLEKIQKKITNFAAILSETPTNPVFNYH